MGMYVFAGIVSILTLMSTTFLVWMELLDASAYTLVVGTIIGGTFGVMNPRPPQTPRDPAKRTRAADTSPEEE